MSKLLKIEKYLIKKGDELKKLKKALDEVETIAREVCNHCGNRDTKWCNADCDWFVTLGIVKKAKGKNKQNHLRCHPEPRQPVLNFLAARPLELRSKNSKEFFSLRRFRALAHYVTLHGSRKFAVMLNLFQHLCR